MLTADKTAARERSHIDTATPDKNTTRDALEENTCAQHKRPRPHAPPLLRQHRQHVSAVRREATPHRQPPPTALASRTLDQGAAELARESAVLRATTNAWLSSPRFFNVRNLHASHRYTQRASETRSIRIKRIRGRVSKRASLATGDTGTDGTLLLASAGPNAAAMAVR